MEIIVICSPCHPFLMLQLDDGKVRCFEIRHKRRKENLDFSHGDSDFPGSTQKKNTIRQNIISLICIRIVRSKEKMVLLFTVL